MDSAEKLYDEEGGKTTPYLRSVPGGGYKKSEAADEARSKLRAAEDGASSKPVWHYEPGSSNSTDSASKAESKPLDSARSGENNIPFTGSGLKGQNSKSKSGFKKYGPTFGIFGGLLGLVGLLFGGFNSILPVHISQLVKENFDSQHTSMSIRSIRHQNFLLEDRSVSNRFFSFKEKRYRGFTRKQVRQLTQNGIEVLDGSGNPVTDAAVRKPSALRHVIEIDGELRSADIFPDDFIDAFGRSESFRTSYMKSVRSMGSRVAGWFDGIAAKVLSKIPGIRNLFKDFINETNAMNSKNKEGISEVFNTTVNKRLSVETDIGTRNVEEVEQDDGTKVKEIDPNEESIRITGDNTSTKPSLSARRAKILSGAESLKAKINAGQVVTNLACAGVQVYNAVTLITSALKMMQVVEYSSGFLEAADRTMAGETNEHLVSEWGDRLVTRANDEVVDSNGNLEILDTSRTAMESPGMSYITTGNFPDSSDPVTSQFILESMTAMTQAMVGCGIASGAMAALSLGVNIVAAVASGGLSVVFKGFFKQALFATLTAVVGYTISALLPTIAQSLAGELINSFTLGAPVGEAITTGSHAYTNKVSSGGGLSPGNRDSVLAYYNETQEVIAQERELDKSNRSPFDITSKNTFLGSLLVGLYPITSSSGSIGSIFTTIGSLTSQSIASLLPTSSAIDRTEFEKFIAKEGQCPDLDRVGVVGDIYCNPFMISDLSTVEIHPDDIIDMVGIILDGIEETDDGEVKVKEGSNFEYYIKYCSDRESRFGVYDSNIAGDFQIDGAVGAVGNAIPIIDDVFAIIDSIGSSAAVGWIDGQKCTMSEQNEHWEEMKYYQAFIENDRIAESNGVEGKSPVVAYLEEEELKNPTDTSLEGYLARATGMKKEDVEVTLAYMVDIINSQDAEYVAYKMSLGPSVEYFDDENVNLDYLPESTNKHIRLDLINISSFTINSTSLYDKSIKHWITA